MMFEHIHGMKAKEELLTTTVWQPLLIKRKRGRAKERKREKEKMLPLIK